MLSSGLQEIKHLKSSEMVFLDGLMNYDEHNIPFNVSEQKKI